MKYDDVMDPQCISICDALNLIEGIDTFSSCCGHGRSVFSVSFFARNFEALTEVCYWLDHCHSGIHGWRVFAYTDCGRQSHKFEIEGPVGAFCDADAIAKIIRHEAILSPVPHDVG